MMFNQLQELLIFTALKQVARSEDSSLEMLQISEYAAAKLTAKTYDSEEEKLFANLILLAINQTCDLHLNEFCAAQHQGLRLRVGLFVTRLLRSGTNCLTC